MSMGDQVRGEEDGESVEVGTVLIALADLIESLHEDDLALQAAVSKLTPSVRATPEMVDLQHTDLITQLHEDIAVALRVLGNANIDQRIPKHDLKSKLTLRSLQDAILEDEETTDAPVSGELSLF